jgi:hypothetical protein
MIQDECNNVQLLWVPGHNGIEGNETADELAKRARCTHLKDLNPPVVSLKELQGRSSGTGCAEHQEYWQSIPSQRHVNSFLSKLSVKRTVSS